MSKIALSKRGKIIEFSIAIAFIFIGISLRLLPHPPNFAPIAAIALFGGVYLSKKLSLSLPVLVLLISDIFLGFYQFSLMLFVYGSFLLCVVLGFWLKKHKKWHIVLGTSLFGSLIFFFLTNFSVWAFTSWYPKSFSGIIQCYLMALPFFKNTAMGDLFYITVFFGTYELVEVWVREKFRIIKAIPKLAVN